MKGYVVDVKSKKKEFREDDTPLPPAPPRPKLYRVYKTLRTGKGRVVKILFSEPVELTQEEIDELRSKGYEVEELSV